MRYHLQVLSPADPNGYRQAMVSHVTPEKDEAEQAVSEALPHLKAGMVLAIEVIPDAIT